MIDLLENNPEDNFLVSGRTVANRVEENKVTHGIDKRDFIQYLNEFGFDYAKVVDMFETRKISGLLREELSNALLDIKCLYDVNMFDMIIYMHYEFANIETIVNILNPDAMETLKSEVRMRVHDDYIQKFVDFLDMDED